MAQSSQTGNSPNVTTPDRERGRRASGGNSPPSGSSRPDSWIHADGNSQAGRALLDRDGDVVVGDQQVAHLGHDQLLQVPQFPHRDGGGYPADDAGRANPPRDCGGYPAGERGRSRSPGRGGRIFGTRVIEQVEVEFEPDLEELHRRGNELHEQWRVAREQVLWCEQNMVPLDHHEREKREIQLMDEQAAEMVYRQQHEHYTRMVQTAEEEKNRAIQEGQRARQDWTIRLGNCSGFTSPPAIMSSRRTRPSSRPSPRRRSGAGRRKNETVSFNFWRTALLI